MKTIRFALKVAVMVGVLWAIGTAGIVFPQWQYLVVLGGMIIYAALWSIRL